MDKDHIISEIRRTAAENAGQALGRQRFAGETGIKMSDWYGRYWVRWGDAIKEAGLEPNEFTAAFTVDQLLTSLATLMRELGHFPLSAEIRIKGRSKPGFPSHSSFSKLGNKRGVAAKLKAFLLDRGEDDLAALCVLDSDVEKPPERLRPDVVAGYVYLLKSGRNYKIGRSNAVGRRERELAIQLPDKANCVHSIKTDDPVGIEAYWHNRFRDRHKNGEWYALTADDVAAFRRRKFM